MSANLSFEQAPPISVPFRFFLLAPLFGMAAGVLLLIQGGEALSSRWSPALLALTHLFSVGFMLQAMCGALLQFVPVAAGGNVWRPRLLAGLSQPLLALAAIVLAAAFLSAQSWLFPTAGVLFAAGLGLFILVVGQALLRTTANSATVHTLRLAMLGLAMTLLLGLLLVSTLGWQGRFGGLLAAAGWSLPRLVDVHVAWGVAGWALLLVMAVSYLVVPMFLLTPAYPQQLSRWLPWALLLVLLFWSLAQLLAPLQAVPWLLDLIILAGLLCVAVYAGSTLRLQKNRRRRLVDPTFLFWRSAMLSLLALLLSWLVLRAVPALAQHPRSLLWLGVLVFQGCFVALISGMLYKIVPFMIWLHLQKFNSKTVLPPNMKQMIAERSMRGHLHAHLLALLLLLLAVIWPPLAALAGAALVLNFAWLGWNLLQGLRVYVNFCRKHAPASVLHQGSN